MTASDEEGSDGGIHLMPAPTYRSLVRILKSCEQVQQGGLSTTRISPYAHRRSFLQGYIRLGEDLDGTIAQAKSLAQGLTLQNQFSHPLIHFSRRRRD